MPTPPEILAAMERFAADLAATDEYTDHNCANALLQQLAAVADGSATTRLVVRLTRLLSTSADDEEWAQSTAFVEVTLSPGDARLTSFENHASMIGADQTDVLLMDRYRPVDPEVEDRWQEEVARMLAHPDHSASYRTDPWPEKVVLRDTHDGADHRHLEAYFDAEGNLHVDGQDLGPGTAPVSDDGEYEWFQTIRQEHVHDLMTALVDWGADQPLEVLRRFAGRADHLEQVLRTGVVPVERQIWSG